MFTKCLILTLFSLAPVLGMAENVAYPGAPPSGQGYGGGSSTECSGSSSSKTSSGGGCGQIVVDCAAHTIKMNGIENMKSDTCPDPTKINCGGPTVNSHGKGGRIGGLHCGPVVPDGVEIEGIPGMGASGGEKVFHTPNPKDERSCPNGGDSTHGCIAVCKTVLEKLKTCRNANLTITGAKGSKADNREPAANAEIQYAYNSIFDRLFWIQGLELLQCPAANADTLGRDTYPMAPGQLIDIDSYEPLSRTYEVVNVEFWGQGPLIVSPEELSRTVGAIKIDRILRNPTSIIHNQFMTEKSMTLMMPQLVEARKKMNGN